MGVRSKIVSVAMSAVLAVGLCPAPAFAAGGGALRVSGAAAQGQVTTADTGSMANAVFKYCDPSGNVISSGSYPVVGIGDAGKSVWMNYRGNGASASYQLQYVFQTSAPIEMTGNVVYLDGNQVPSDAFEWVFYSVDEDVWTPIAQDGYTKLESAPAGLGRYAVAARGVGDYSGESQKAEIEIIAANDLKGATVALSNGLTANYETVLPCTGNPVDAEFAVTFRGATLREGADYAVSYKDDDGNAFDGAPTDVGYYKAEISAAPSSGYVGSVECDFQVVSPTDLTYGKVTVPGGVYETYPWNNGAAVVPSDLVVTDVSGNVLGKECYTLVYSKMGDFGTTLTSITDEGTYYVYAKGANGYSGATSMDAEAVICVAKPEHDISKASVSMAPAYSYNGGSSMENVLAPKVTLAGKTLTQGADYRLFYSKSGWGGSGSLGKHQVWLLGMGDYLGGQWLSYTVVDGAVSTDTTEKDANEKSSTDEKSSADDKTETDSPSDKVLAVGATASVGGATYKVTDAAAVTVSYKAAPTSKAAATVPAAVTINGKKYAVTGIAKNAFKKSKAKTVTIKSAKLTKKGVKGCFKGSKVKTVKVKVGSKKANKKAIKKYKKYFTKANCGKKVTVK